MKMTRVRQLILFALAVLAMPAWLQAADFITGKHFGGENEIVVTFAGPANTAVAGDVSKYTIYEEADPDIKLPLKEVLVADDAKSATLVFVDSLNTTKTHVVTIAGLTGEATTAFTVAKPYFGYLLSIMISALLIQNFVFTKYLGLCVFFGTSKKKSTAKGMGVVFTIVMVISAAMSWFFFQFVLVPYNLGFLQIVVFIGLVSLTVQAVDTILRKVNPVLFNSFGVFLVLVIANCIVIAVPLILASNNYNFLETMMLALGAGGGFLLALYLMSSVAERLELARIPPTFKGLPMAFIVAGQFAMAFLGFSGLQLF